MSVSNLGNDNKIYCADDENIERAEAAPAEVPNEESRTEFTFETEKNEEKTKVKRTVGVFGAINIVVGTMIGSGIFASTAPVFTHASSIGLSLVIWLLSGMICVGAALCYAELGTMIPKSGGEFVYLREAYGEIPAFLFAFTNTLISKPAQITAIVMATANYVTTPFAALQHDPENQVLVAKILTAFFLGNTYIFFY